MYVLKHPVGRSFPHAHQQRQTVKCQYEIEKAPSRPPPPPPPPPPRQSFNMVDRRALLLSLGGLGLGVTAASKLMSQDSTSSMKRRRTTAKDDPWRGPVTEAMQSDVVEDEGEVAVRMSTGNWYLLKEDPENRKAFILEGGFGDRYRLQTDKPVKSFSMKMLQRIFYRHNLWEKQLVRLQ